MKPEFQNGFHSHSVPVRTSSRLLSTVLFWRMKTSSYTLHLSWGLDMTAIKLTLPSGWPGPGVLILSKSWCDNSITLLMWSVTRDFAWQNSRVSWSERPLWLLGKFNGGHEGEMFRSFHRLYSSLFTFDGLLERRLNTLRVLYLRTSSVNLRSSDNKVMKIVLRIVLRVRDIQSRFIVH